MPDLPLEMNKEIADELQFVDYDIREAFKGKCYAPGTPTMLHLARAIKQATDQHGYGSPMHTLGMHLTGIRSDLITLTSAVKQAHDATEARFGNIRR